MVFHEVKLNYDMMEKDIETRMNTCSAAGLLTTLADLEKRMSVINTHKAELERLERDFRNNDSEASVPLQSYNCGFLRGVATIVMTTPQRGADTAQATPISGVSFQMASA